MQIFRCYHTVFSGLPTCSDKLYLFLFWALLTVFPFKAQAFTIDINVADGVGGQIISAPDDTECFQNCTILAFQQSRVSLFAIPERGYRFSGWDGACASTIGPLCTFEPSEDSKVTARFEKSKASLSPAKVLLLLHDAGGKYTVWNEFVKQHFNNRCPVIYGGVILEKDSYNSSNKVYCYRVRFGYYDLLNQSKISSSEHVGEATSLLPDLSANDLGSEVQAAVLGILNRHSNLRLALVGQARAELAARSFLQTNTAGLTDLVGTFVLQPSGGYKSETEIVPTHEAKTEIYSLEAQPEQGGMISAALAQLTKSWWTAR